MSVATFNPNTVNITLSESTLTHIQKILGTHPEAQGFRFSLKKSGCSGLSYVAELVTHISDTDISIPNSQHLAIYVAKDSLQYLNGLTVDYVKKGLGQSQLIYINPNETGRCGCGESFSTKKI